MTVGILKKRDFCLTCNIERNSLKGVPGSNLLIDDGLEEFDRVVDHVLHGYAVDLLRKGRLGGTGPEGRPGIYHFGYFRDGEVVLRNRGGTGVDSFSDVPLAWMICRRRIREERSAVE